MTEIVLRHAETVAEINACFPVMVLLRPHLANPEEFMTRVARQHEAGYRLLVAWREGAPIGLAGYRLEENLIRGRFIYLDDLVISEGERRQVALACWRPWRPRDAGSAAAGSTPFSITGWRTASTTARGCWRAPCGSAGT